MNEKIEKDSKLRTSIFLQMVYTFFEVILGFILMVIGAIAVDNKNGLWNIQNPSKDGQTVPTHGNGSAIAMVVIGVIILLLAAYSGYILWRMFKEYKNGSMSDTTAIMAATSLNVLAFMFINETNGKVKPKMSKEEKAKLKASNKAAFKSK